MKRIITLLMACVLIFSNLTAQAASRATTTIQAKCEIPDVEVCVPSTGSVYLNPKRLPISMKGQVQTDQIVNDPWSIENHSQIRIRVDAAAYGTVKSGSEMMFYPRSVASQSFSSKYVFMYLDAKTTDPGVDLESLNWSSSVFDSAKNIVISEDYVEKDDILCLAAADENGTVADGGVGAFRLNGDMITNPSEAWNSYDGVTVSIVFTFEPIGNDEP